MLVRGLGKQPSKGLVLSNLEELLLERLLMSACPSQSRLQNERQAYLHLIPAASREAMQDIYRQLPKGA